MPYFRAKLLIALLTAMLNISAFADSIHIHTDNLEDFQALKSNNGHGNLSVSTNLFALEKEHPLIKFEYMTPKRSLQFMDEGKSICVVNRIKTQERLDKYIFSKPINLFLGWRLYQKTEFQPLDASSHNQRVNLSELFVQKPDSQIIITEQNSYGDVLDDILAKLPDQNKTIRYGGESDIGIINMFAKGRAEFALLYPQQVFTFIANINVRSYEIESIPAYVLGHLMCTKNEATIAFIEQVNQHLGAENSNEKLLDVHLNFINPNDVDMFKYYFRQAFLK